MVGLVVVRLLWILSIVWQDSLLISLLRDS